VKNLVVLPTRDDVIDYVRSLFRSDLFKESEYVQGWIERFAAHPAVFAEMSQVELEYAHFATWFGMTYRRDYPEPIVSDLYYLHELVHASLLSYAPRPLFTAWYRKMNGIEFSASLETESYVYLSIPGLREASFPDEIWADRFLGGKSRLGESLRDVIRQERYRAMREPDPMDYCEQQIAAYARQNFEWANCWRLEVAKGEPAFAIVEDHLTRFRAGEISIEGHVEWLHRFGEIPFPDQARLFSAVYWNNKLSYRLKKL
jgi:hypothetical protein